MKHYIELTLIPQAELSPYHIWSKLFTQAHLALVESKDANGTCAVGVSFPQYRMEQTSGRSLAMLGSKLRLFAPTEGELQALKMEQWLNRLLDYVHISSIKAVPTDRPIHHLTVQRYRPKMDVEKVAARFAQHKNISLDEARTHCLAHKRKVQNPPYILMKSLGGGQSFSLEVQQRNAAQAVAGRFSTYGLSSTATVPHWE